MIGLELTATPFVEARPAPVWFRNVIYDYPLAKAMEDGFVKEPAVVTRKNFDPKGMSPEALEQLKLEDGVRLHEGVKVELETYARQTGENIVKPFVLVIAQDTTHAGALMALIKSERFFDGRYAAKVIQVDSSKSGEEKDEVVQRLLKVEDAGEPTEIVIHVNMLKEGWDVTNLYTIVPLRAANARTLIEQSIGRGLRLPYGRRTGVAAVDRLNIVAHDRFKEIVDEAGRPDSPIRLQQVILDPEQLRERTVTVVSQPQLASILGLRRDGAMPAEPSSDSPPAFPPGEEKIAQIAYGVMRKYETQPERLSSVTWLQNADVQAEVLREVQAQWRPAQLELDGVVAQPDLAAIVSRTAELVVQKTIDIPRILVVPKGEVKAGFRPFTLDLATIRYPTPSDELWIQYLRTSEREIVGLGAGGYEERQLEDYVVSGLIDFDDIAYDEQSALLYDLAGQVVTHLLTYLSEDDARKVLRLHQREIATFVHAQMQDHAWQDDTVEYEVSIRRGFTTLRDSAYSAPSGEDRLDFRRPPPDIGGIARYVFGGFERCLYDSQKFQSNTERELAVIVDRDTQKWFRPASGQFQIFYRDGADQREYIPDFVAEGDDSIFMLEPKALNQMEDREVLAKRDAAVEWCRQASAHTTTYGGKPWRYALIPHTAIAPNVTLAALAERYVVAAPAVTRTSGLT